MRTHSKLRSRVFSAARFTDENALNFASDCQASPAADDHLERGIRAGYEIALETFATNVWSPTDKVEEQTLAFLARHEVKLQRYYGELNRQPVHSRI